MEREELDQLAVAALEAWPHAVFLQDPHGTVLRANDAARRGMGLDEHELHGRDRFDPIWTLVDEHGEQVPPDEFPGYIAGTTGRAVTDRLVGVVLGSAELRWIRIDAIPLLGEDGAVRAVAVHLRNVTNTTRADMALRRTEARLERARRAGGVGLWEWNPLMRTLTVDDRFVEVMGGHRPESLEQWIELVQPEDRPSMRSELFSGASGPEVRHVRFRSEDGERRWFRVRSELLSVVDGDAAGRLAGTVVDTTELCRTTERVTELLDYMTDAYFTLDADGTFTFLNRAAAAMLDPHGLGLVGRTIFRVFPREAHDLRFRFERVIAGETVDFEKYYPEIGGWFEVRAHPVPEGIAVYFRNIDDDWNARNEREQMLFETEAANARLRRAATTDELTGLYNRMSLLEWLDRRLADTSARRPAVLFIDLDRFKLVNDTHGHAEGDKLLKEVASRLLSLVRSGDAVARLGGDEFIIAITAENDEQVHQLAQRVLEQMRYPIVIEGRRIVVNASIGISFANELSSVETLLRDADAAMYQAKDLGRNRAEVFDDRIRQDMVRRLDVEIDLHGAAARGELRAAYQAVFDARTGEAVAAESLARWRHPRKGLLGAGSFIPVAEESGLIVEIGDAMLELAIADLPTLERVLGGPQVRAWVNVSSRQLEEPGFAVELVDRLRSAGHIGRIGIEVTETGLIRDHANTTSLLSYLANSGVPIAIDDFGTGYSSMARLVDFPVDMLKIDQSFVQGLETRNTAPVIAAMVEVANAVGAMTCAEGIETDEQLDTLLALGVDLLSGYHLGRPVPLEALAASLVEPRRRVGAALSDAGRAPIAAHREPVRELR